MIQKPNKPPQSPTSYRPISLLPILGKMFEKLLLRRLYPLLESQNIIPNHQFGFRSEHSTIQQCHRVTNLVAASLENGEFCASVFLDANQAFDRVWHPGLLFKLKSLVPSTYFLILKSYLKDRFFQVSQYSSNSQIFQSLLGVPQGSILAPFLFTIYTSDIPSHPHTSLYTFADDTAILSHHCNPNIASLNLQEHLNAIQKWVSDWKFKINCEKSVNITFTLKKTTCPPVFINGNLIPSADVVRYLGMHLDKRLTWNPHTRLKRLNFKQRFQQLYRLLRRNSKLPLNQKLTLYKTILRPIWTYGIELWGSTKPSNIQRIQSLQSRILRTIACAPFYVSNDTLHNDLKIPYVKDLATTRYRAYHLKLPSHSNPLVSTLALPAPTTRRLKRKWPRDLLE